MPLRSGSWLAHVHLSLPWGLGRIRGGECKVPEAARCRQGLWSCSSRSTWVRTCAAARQPRPRRPPAEVPRDSDLPSTEKHACSGGNACTSIIPIARTGPLEAPAPKSPWCSETCPCLSCPEAAREPIEAARLSRDPRGLCLALGATAMPPGRLLLVQEQGLGPEPPSAAANSPHLLAGKVQFPGGRLL